MELFSLPWKQAANKTRWTQQEPTVFTNHDGSDSGKKQETIYPITSLLTENNPQSSTDL